MSAGQPNWQKLSEMGKLPKNQRGQIPSLALADSLEKRIAEFKKGCCDECRAKFFAVDEEPSTDVVEAKCEVEGCDFVAKGKSKAVAENYLRLHSKSHAPKA